MEFREIMKEFGAKIGLADLAPDDTNGCYLDVDGMTVSFREYPETGELVTSAEVGEPPAEGAEMLYRMLLESMFMGRNTAGSSFSIEPESGRLFLHRIDSTATLDFDSFSRMFEQFVNTLEQWRKLIVDFRPVAEAIEKTDAETAQSSEFGMSGFMQV